MTYFLGMPRQISDVFDIQQSLRAHLESSHVVPCVWATNTVHASGLYAPLPRLTAHRHGLHGTIQKDGGVVGIIDLTIPGSVVPFNETQWLFRVRPIPDDDNPCKDVEEHYPENGRARAVNSVVVVLPTARCMPARECVCTLRALQAWARGTAEWQAWSNKQGKPWCVPPFSEEFLGWVNSHKDANMR